MAGLGQTGGPFTSAKRHEIGAMIRLKVMRIALSPIIEDDAPVQIACHAEVSRWCIPSKRTIQKRCRRRR